MCLEWSSEAACIRQASELICASFERPDASFQVSTADADAVKESRETSEKADTRNSVPDDGVC